MENQEKVHKRRVRYSGTHPRSYKEKYKEHNPEKYADVFGYRKKKDEEEKIREEKRLEEERQKLEKLKNDGLKVEKIDEEHELIELIEEI